MVIRTRSIAKASGLEAGSPGRADPLEILDQLLITRLIVTGADLKFRRFPFRQEESIPSEPRLILIRRGRAEFHMDNFTLTAGPGMMILLPAWIRRSWKTTRQPGFVSVAWCRFSSSGAHLHDLATPLYQTLENPRLELEAVQRIVLRLRTGHSADAQVAEGELKALLGRFLRHARAPDHAACHHTRPLSCGQQGVQLAVQHMRSHFSQGNVLRGLPKTAGLHPKYFRSLFRRTTGVTPGNYLIRLRMRAARYYQHETAMRVKEVAAAVGYRDAFYFSRMYRRFWGHAPTLDRPIHQAASEREPGARR